MIEMKELLGRPMKIPAEHQANLDDLLIKLNKLRAAYGKPLQVTSGYRTMATHLAIYAAKGITDQSKIPMQSRHLYGLAADLVPVDEPIEAFHKWVLDNIQLMVDIGLWMESFEATKTWTHFQSVPPASGKRFFIP